MITSAYKFADEGAYISLIKDTKPHTVDVIGTVYIGHGIAANGAPLAPPTATPGWYVNIIWGEKEPTPFTAFRIDPETAPRWWSGMPRAPVAPPPAPVPETITPLQARRALRSLGLLDAVASFMAKRPEVEREAWEYCVEVRRDDPMILGAATALGLNSTEVDQLFTLGASL